FQGGGAPAPEAAPDGTGPGGTGARRPGLDAPDTGLSGESASVVPAVLRGIACALIWLAAWLLGRLWRRWPAYLLGLPVFLVVLFMFFENFSRLLPANF